MPPSYMNSQRTRSFSTSRTIIALMLREMATTYGRSAFGYLWAIAEPVGGILLLTVIFSIAFDSPPLGTSFALFYASGFLTFTIYSNIQAKVGTAIRFSKPLLFYPAVTFVDAILARFLLNFLTLTVVAAIILTSIILIFNVGVIVSFPAIFLAILMAGCLGLGVGTINCYLSWVFPAWPQIWAILNRPLFIISGVFFILENVPEPYRTWLWYNPLVHLVGQMRNGLFATYNSEYVSLTYVAAISFGLFFFGILLLRRFHRDIVND